MTDKGTVAGLTAAPAGAARHRVMVALGSRGYAIDIGRGLIAEAGTLLKPHLPRMRAFIITDTNVGPLYLQQLQSALHKAGISSKSLSIPAGEAHKTFGIVERLSLDLLENGVERQDCLIALGGGVVGDITGFVAAILLRGINFVQIPTTLLAQVDSSVGGKTGIDTKFGKNMIGAFHQPQHVLSDLDSLSTLPPRELRAGYAEIVKYGLIADESFFRFCEAEALALLAGDEHALAKAIRVSCEMKASIVQADEREAGARALLNLGHTFAHALEAETGFSDELLHGEAVSIGLAWAFAYSARMGLLPSSEGQRVERHLRATGLPVHPRDLGLEYVKAERLLEHMRRDKKVKNGRIALILARGIGSAFVSTDAEESTLLQFLEEMLGK